MHFDKKLDTRGRTCPLPILQAKRALAGMTSGQILCVLATDLSTVKDFDIFTKQTGHELLSQTTQENELTFFLRRK